MTIDPTARIHPSAVIEDGATIGAGAIVGPFSLIGAQVTLGAGVEVKSHAVVTGWTDVGDDTVIFPFATAGEVPQDLKYKGERTRLVIGKRCRIRQAAIIGAVTMVTNDVIPYGLVQAPRGELDGLNLVGLKRRGMDRADITAMRAAFQMLSQ